MNRLKTPSILLLVLMLLPVATAAASIDFSGDVQYYGTDSGGYVKFASDFTADQAYWSNNVMRFTGFTMNGVTWPDIGFACSTGDNATIQELKSHEIKYAVTDGDSSGYTVTTFYVNNMGPPKQVIINGATYTIPSNSKSQFDAANYETWFHDQNTKLLYVKTTGSTVRVLWTAPSPAAPGAPPAPSPGPTPPTPPGEEFWQSEFLGVPLWLWLAAMLVAVVIILWLLKW